MKIVFLGSVINKDEIGHLSGGSIAGNKMQYNILKNLNMYGMKKA